MPRQAQHFIADVKSSFNPLRASLQAAAVFEGCGVHGGTHAVLKILPAPAGHGLVFQRTDLPGQPRIPALWHKVDETRFYTRITHDGVSVCTVEHLLAALAACGIYDALIQINGPELPIMDGSSRVFTDKLRPMLRMSAEPAPLIPVTKTLRVENRYGWASLSPAAAPSFVVTVDQKQRLGERFGLQQATLDWENKDAVFALLQARTFGTYQEGMALQNIGLAKGASLDNTIVIDNDRVLNSEGLRFANEPAAHKILDAVGDLALSGGLILGLYQGYNAGHELNNQLLRAFLANA